MLAPGVGKGLRICIPGIVLGIDILNHATGPIADIPVPVERFQPIVDGDGVSVVLPRFERELRLPKGIVTVD